MKNHKQHGFTIVELLVVVVVIAILAAITIVSYNGIIARAENTKLLANVDAWTKTLLLYKAEKGVFPNTSPTNASQNFCLGSTFEQTTDFGLNKCILISDTSAGLVDYDNGFNNDPAFNTLIRNTVDIPTSERPPLFITSGTFSMKQRGLLYIVSPGSQTATLFYDTKGDVECARGQKTSNPGYTRCILSLE